MNFITKLRISEKNVALLDNLQLRYRKTRKLYIFQLINEQLSTECNSFPPHLKSGHQPFINSNVYIVLAKTGNIYLENSYHLTTLLDNRQTGDR